MESAGHLRENSDAYFDRAKAAMSWWDSLQPKPTQKGDRAALSKLRRAMPLEAMAQESTVRLFYRLGYSAEERSRLPRVATLACVLAHVREHDQTVKFANAVGRKTVEDKDSALLKPLRFQRLLAAESDTGVPGGWTRLRTFCPGSGCGWL